MNHSHFTSGIFFHLSRFRLHWIEYFFLSVVPFALLSPSAFGSDFQGIGDLPGGAFYSRAFGVSADGSTVVGHSISSNGYEAFRWRNGIMEPLGDLPGGEFNSFATGVSGDGSVVVGRGTTANDDHAFRWEAGALVGLEVAPGYTSSNARKVSRDGHIIAGWATIGRICCYSKIEGVSWMNGVPFAMGDLPGGYFDSAAGDVSAVGSVLGGRSRSLHSDFYEAFSWTTNGMVPLGDLAGGRFFSEVLGTSGDARVMVGSSASARSSQVNDQGEACRWNNGVISPLGDLPGGAFFSYAWAVNDDGSVIVGAGTTDLGREAFIWDAFHGIRNLREVLTNDLDVDLSGWILSEAIAISADGKTIVGEGIHNGNTEGWIARISCTGTDATQPLILTNGKVSSPGISDEWTFSGHGGEKITALIDTGSGSISLPWLNYAEIRLLDVNSNVLAQANNTLPQKIVSLTAIALPADGTYRLQVRAPANQPGSTGNYLAAIWKVTVDESTLSPNQSGNGRIESPYSMDRWKFSAVAGQILNFDLLNICGFGVAFDLVGPNGWTGFTELANDTNLITLPQSGNYTLTAHGVGASYDINYAFKLTGTDPTDLPFNTNFTGQLIGSGQAQIFRIAVSNIGPIHITFLNSGIGNHVELYASFGTAPTRGVFDFQSSDISGANQDIFIPCAVFGTYYVLVFSDHVPTPGSFNIQVTASGVILSDINPKSQGNNVPFTMTLTGAGFEAGTEVELVGATTLVATNVSVDSYSQLTAGFAPSSAPPGMYSVQVRQPDGDEDVLSNAFEMLPSGEPHLETKLILPSALGRHAVATLYVEYANTGTASMPAPLIQLRSTDSDDSDKPILSLNSDRLSQNLQTSVLPQGSSHSITILASGQQAGFLHPGERIRVPVYYAGLLQPWNFRDTQVEMGLAVFEATDQKPMNWEGITYGSVMVLPPPPPPAVATSHH